MTSLETDNPRLLLVDDDETFCNVLKSALEKRGFDVVAATNVVDGIFMAEKHIPEYAVIDLRIGQIGTISRKPIQFIGGGFFMLFLRRSFLAVLLTASLSLLSW